jgi:hypothetical protein
MIELEHSPLGGSAAHRFMNCEGSFLLQRELIEAGELENIESEYAKLGTAAHELGAKAIATETEPFEFLGGNSTAISPAGRVAFRSTPYRSIFPSAWAFSPGAKSRAMLVEETIHLPEIHPLLRGTVDFGFWSMSDGIFLRDYKNGEGIGVSAPGNKQLLYYGYLMILKILSDGHELPREMPVSLGIVQPNFYGHFRSARRVGNHGRLRARLGHERIAAPHEIARRHTRTMFWSKRISFPASGASFARSCWTAHGCKRRSSPMPSR